jgi:hypothetical protein
MGTPPRHGHDWSQVPVPARRLEPVASLTSSSAAAKKTETTSAAKSAVAGTIPVEILHAFYQALPPYGVQHFALTFQIPYTLVDFVNGNVGSMVFVQSVPQGLVHIITDVKNFALIPGTAFNAPMQELGHYALLGLLRFSLLIGDRSSMQFDTVASSPNLVLGTTTLRTGWSILDEKFGAQRSGGFAVYARSQQSIIVNAYPDDVPNFNVSRVGAHMHGFSVPEATFEEIFRKHR